MALPTTYSKKNETGCCAIPDLKAWDDKRLSLKDHHFIRGYVRSLMFIPLNMGKVIGRLHSTAVDAKTELPPTKSLLISKDVSPWKAEQLYGVSKPVEGADNVTLEGTYLSRVFEGPYSKDKTWYREMVEVARKAGSEFDEVRFFYTTCPKCAKHYGVNKVVALARVA
jgi:hypothetical protein